MVRTRKDHSNENDRTRTKRVRTRVRTHCNGGDVGDGSEAEKER